MILNAPNKKFDHVFSNYSCIIFTSLAWLIKGLLKVQILFCSFTFLNNDVDLVSPGVGLGGDPTVALLLKLLLRILPVLLLLFISFGLLPSGFLSIIFPERKMLWINQHQYKKQIE